MTKATTHIEKLLHVFATCPIGLAKPSYLGTVCKAALYLSRVVQKATVLTRRVCGLYACQWRRTVMEEAGTGQSLYIFSLSRNLFVGKNFFPPKYKRWAKNPLFLEEFRGKVKFRTPIISSVRKSRMSVGKMQLSVPYFSKR